MIYLQLLPFGLRNNQVLLNIVKNSLDEFKRFEIENPKIKILCSLNEKDFNIDIID